MQETCGMVLLMKYKVPHKYSNKKFEC